MKQSEYLRELEINLESRLSPAEVKDILSDYESFFAAGREEGKCDDGISEELGSPAYLAKTLIEEHNGGRSGKESDQEPGLGSDSKSEMAVKRAANPGRRLCAYLIDSVIAVLPMLILSLTLMASTNIAFMMLAFSPSPLIGALTSSSYSAYTVFKSEGVINSRTIETNQDVISSSTIETGRDRDGIDTYVYRKGPDGEWTTSKPNKGAIAFAVFSLAFYLFYSMASTILFKGQTIGKKIMGVRVRRTGAGEASGGMIFIREFLGKVLLNSIPVIPLISLLAILLTKDHRALHDMLADTVVTDL